ERIRLADRKRICVGEPKRIGQLERLREPIGEPKRGRHGDAEPNPEADGDAEAEADRSAVTERVSSSAPGRILGRWMGPLT
ncbi:MAG: hypothetical protein ACHP93_07080, partial [Solirubrobacterales bacterium]